MNSREPAPGAAAAPNTATPNTATPDAATPDAAAPLAAARPHAIAAPHGVRIDPYYWLRDDERQNGEMLAYLRAENAYKERKLAASKPLEEKLYGEIIATLETGRYQRPLS